MAMAIYNPKSPSISNTDLDKLSNDTKTSPSKCVEPETSSDKESIPIEMINYNANLKVSANLIKKLLINCKIMFSLR